MWIRIAKILLPSQKSVIFGLIFVLLMLILSCGYIQQTNHLPIVKGIECYRSLSLMMNFAPTKDNGLFLIILFFSFIAPALFIKNGLRKHLHSNKLSRPSLIFLKATESIPKLYNPILQALRRGILQSQIYNFAVS